MKEITTLITLVVWGIGLMFLLDNLGFKISAVIAGLGIGGIAVALAAQTILGDLFSYFVIFFSTDLLKLVTLSLLITSSELLNT